MEELRFLVVHSSQLLQQAAMAYHGHLLQGLLFLRRKSSKGSVNWQAHCCMKAAVGCGVMPAIWMRRVASSMMNRT